MEDNKIEWLPSTEWPDVVSENNSGCSIDVFVYDPKTDEHTVGWYNFDLFTWQFLRNEDVAPRFVWRYFVDMYDRHKPKKVKK